MHGRKPFTQIIFCSSGAFLLLQSQRFCQGNQRTNCLPETRTENRIRRYQMFVKQSRRMAVLQAHYNTSPLEGKTMLMKGIMVVIFLEQAVSSAVFQLSIKMTRKSSLLCYRTNRKGKRRIGVTCKVRTKTQAHKNTKYMTCVQFNKNSNMPPWILRYNSIFICLRKERQQRYFTVVQQLQELILCNSNEWESLGQIVQS